MPRGCVHLSTYGLTRSGGNVHMHFCRVSSNACAREACRATDVGAEEPDGRKYDVRPRSCELQCPSHTSMGIWEKIVADLPQATSTVQRYAPVRDALLRVQGGVVCGRIQAEQVSVGHKERDGRVHDASGHPRRAETYVLQRVS